MTRTRRKDRCRGDTAVLFPDTSIPGAILFSVKFVFMGYHPTDGEFEKSFSGRVKTRNQNEAILKALDLVVQRYPQYFFQYQVGPRIGSGAYLVYKNGQHFFVRAANAKEAALLIPGNKKVFFIQVKPCP